MLVPAIAHKEELINKLSNSPDISLVCGSQQPQNIFASPNTFIYVSLDQAKNIIGFFSYKILPISANDNNKLGVCDIKTMSFVRNSITYGRDFLDLFTNYIFAENNNIIRASFKCYTNNPICDTYAKYVRKINGEIISNKTHTSVFFRIRRNNFLQFANKFYQKTRRK